MSMKNTVIYPMEYILKINLFYLESQNYIEGGIHTHTQKERGGKER